MSLQFKKFLVLLVSVGLGVLTFMLLIKIFSIKNSDNYNAGPAFGIVFGPISLVSMFIYYFYIIDFLDF